MSKVQIAIADDHLLVRNGIMKIINELNDFIVSIDASHGQELLNKLENAKEIPDIAIIDISMPILDGFETVLQINKIFPSIKCIALSVHSDFNSVFRMIQYGAKAYLLKDCSPQQMEETLLKVYREGSYYNSFVVDSLMEYNRDSNEKRAKIVANTEELTERELEFVKWCCSELTYKEIADRMSVSPRTVDGYREEVFDKLGLQSRVGIVLFAIKNSIYSI